MIKSLPIPDNENERLKDLASYDILDSIDEQDYDSITALASSIAGTPIALISLVDANRQWFKSRVGLEATETPRNISFCQYAIMGDEMFEVENALEDPTFNTNPLVTGAPNIRHYAGVPLTTPTGHNIGTLCVISPEPGSLSSEQKTGLTTLAKQVINQLELKKKNKILVNKKNRLINFSIYPAIFYVLPPLMGSLKRLTQGLVNFWATALKLS